MATTNAVLKEIVAVQLFKVPAGTEIAVKVSGDPAAEWRFIRRAHSAHPHSVDWKTISSVREFGPDDVLVTADGRQVSLPANLPVVVRGDL